MSKKIEKYREYYLNHQWSYKMVENLLKAGKITQEEFEYIVAEQ